MLLCKESWEAYLEDLGVPRDELYIVCTSCPGDPLHSGHIACLKDGERIGTARVNLYNAQSSQGSGTKLLLHVVIVNADSFLLNKKGYYLLPQEERATIIGSLGCVDKAVIWASPTGSQKVHEALEIIRPDVFYKGGDVKSHNFNQEERGVCERLGIELIFGAGGEKTESSSDFFAEAVRRLGDRVLTPELLRGSPRV